MKTPASHPNLTVVFLHGALLGKGSMRPIAVELKKALPGIELVFLELPGHGDRAGEDTASFLLDDLAADARAGLEQALGGQVEWSQIGLVGESTGGLVLARLVASLPQPPAFTLLGEPPLSNAANMAHVRAELLSTAAPAGRRLAEDLLRLTDAEPTSWIEHFITLPAPSLLVYGEARPDTAKPPIVPSIVTPEDIQALEGASSLVTVGVAGRGHRVLQAMARYWATLIKGMLVNGATKEFQHTRFQPE